MEDSNGDVRAAAVSALGNLGQSNERVIDDLLFTLQDVEWVVKDAAVSSLIKKFRQADERVITTLLTILKNGDYDVEDAAWALGNLGQTDERVITALLTILKDKKDEVRQAAASALRNLRQTDERVVVALSIALQDKSIEDKDAVATALVKTLLSHNYIIDDLKKIAPELTKRKFLTRQNRSFYFEGEKATSYILEVITLEDWTSIFDTPNAVRIIIKAFMREDEADSIYYALPFFNIRRLKLPIALELVQELANPLTDERTKLVIFQLFMRVELVDEKGQPLRQEREAK